MSAGLTSGVTPAPTTTPSVAPLRAAGAAGQRQEVTIIGQLIGATELGANNAQCVWNLRAGSSWIHLSGATHGSSQCDAPAEGGAHVFQHPIDAVFEGSELRGWPRLELELRFFDVHGRSDVAGYAVVHVPTGQGFHRLSCPVWQPRGSLMDRIAASCHHPNLCECSLLLTHGHSWTTGLFHRWLSTTERLEAHIWPLRGRRFEPARPCSG